MGLPLTDEDIRARAWRDARRHRVEIVRERLQALRGSPEARRRLEDNWAALSPEVCDDDEVGQQEQ